MNGELGKGGTILVVLAVLVLGVIPTIWMFAHSIHHPAPAQACAQNPLLVCKAPNHP
jgi:hypothetical protein